MMKSQVEKARKVWISLIFSLSQDCDEELPEGSAGFSNVLKLCGLLVDFADFELSGTLSCRTRPCWP